MTIYATPFDGDTMETTGPSVDSGFTDIDRVREMLGEPLAAGAHGAWLVYGGPSSRVIYSRTPWASNAIARSDNND